MHLVLLLDKRVRIDMDHERGVHAADDHGQRAKRIYFVYAIDLVVCLILESQLDDSGKQDDEPS